MLWWDGGCVWGEGSDSVGLTDEAQLRRVSFRGRGAERSRVRSRRTIRLSGRCGAAIGMRCNATLRERLWRRASAKWQPCNASWQRTYGEGRGGILTGLKYSGGERAAVTPNTSPVTHPSPAAW